MNELQIKYWGHSCFSVTKADYTVVFDPYGPGSVPGLAALDLTANAVLCSHGHGDHGYARAVRVTGGAGPFAVERFVCPHDDAGGKKRGMNTVHILRTEGLSLAHMGDVGCALPEEQLERLRGVDVLLVPVGGYYTIDAAQAHALAEAVGARVVIPMHYRTARSGFDVIGTVEEFTALRQNVRHCGDSITVDGDTPACTAVLEQAMLVH